MELSFQKSKHDFRERSINYLMPAFIAKIHDAILRNFIKKGQSKYINDYVTSYMLNANGFIQPIHIHLSFYFGMDNYACLLASLVKVDKSDHIVVFNEKGAILAISAKLYSKLIIKEALS